MLHDVHHEVITNCKWKIEMTIFMFEDWSVRWINLYNYAFFPQFKNGNFDFDMIVKQLEITMPPEEVVIGKEIVAVCRNEGKDNE